MNHSPRVRTEAPNQDDMKTPTKKMKVMEVTNPRPTNFRRNKKNKKIKGDMQLNKTAIEVTYKLITFLIQFNEAAVKSVTLGTNSI